MFETIAWNTFKNTGSLEAYIFYRQLEQDHNIPQSNLDDKSLQNENIYNNKI